MSIGLPNLIPSAGPADLLAVDRDPHAAVISALGRRPLGRLSLDSAVVLEGRLARAVIRLRLGDDRFLFSPAEAWCLAIAVRLRTGLVAGVAFAEALALAARQATARLDALTRFGVALPLIGEGR